MADKPDWLFNAAKNKNETEKEFKAKNAEVDQIEQFGKAVINGTIKAPTGSAFTDVLWIGIGGSGLGPALMIRALQANGEGLPFHFIDNVDPNGLSNVLGALGERLKTTLVITVSKSRLAHRKR